MRYVPSSAWIAGAIRLPRSSAGETTRGFGAAWLHVVTFNPVLIASLVIVRVHPETKKPGALARSGPRVDRAVRYSNAAPGYAGASLQLCSDPVRTPLVNAVFLILPLRYWARIVLMANLTVNPMDSGGNQGALRPS